MTAKRLFAILVFLGILFSAHPARAQVTFVQAAIGSNAGCSPNCSTAAFGMNTTAGNSILTCVVGHQATGATNSLSSVTGQGSFTPIVGSLVNYGMTANYSNVWGECQIATNITGGATTAEQCTVTTTTGGSCFAYETTPVTGTILTTTGTCASSCNTSNAVSAGSVMTTVNGAFGVTIMAQDDGTGAGAYFGTPGPSWTQSLNAGGGSYEGGSEYLAQATAGSITGNSTAGRSGVVAVSMVVLQSAGGSPPGPSNDDGPTIVF